MLLRGWDKGQESYAHSGAFSGGWAWFLFILQLWPCLEWQELGGSHPGPTHGSVQGDQSADPTRGSWRSCWVVPNWGKRPPPSCPLWGTCLLGTCQPVPPHTFPLIRPDCQSSGNSQPLPTPGLWNHCSPQECPSPPDFLRTEIRRCHIPAHHSVPLWGLGSKPVSSSFSNFP